MAALRIDISLLALKKIHQWTYPLRSIRNKIYNNLSNFRVRGDHPLNFTL